ncbi:MAG: tRNA-binding protein [Methanobacterium sp.]
MWDTTKDYRLLVAEKSVELFLRTIEGANFQGKWNKKKSLSTARDMLPEIQSLYYSYLTPEEISKTPQIYSLEDKVKIIINTLGGEAWYNQFLGLVKREEKNKLEESIAKIKFFINTIYGIRRRLSLGEINDPIIGIDIKTGIVSSISNTNKMNHLLISNVNLGERAIIVVTNDLTVRESDHVAVALLPPAEFCETTSEGMLLGVDGRVLKDVKGELGDIPHDIPLKALNETRNFVESFLNKK